MDFTKVCPIQTISRKANHNICATPYINQQLSVHPAESDQSTEELVRSLHTYLTGQDWFAFTGHTWLYCFCIALAEILWLHYVEIDSEAIIEQQIISTVYILIFIDILSLMLMTVFKLILSQFLKILSLDCSQFLNALSFDCFQFWPQI